MEAQQKTDILTFLRFLVSSVANAALYSREHQQVTRQLSFAYDALVRCLAVHEELSFLLVDEQLVCEGKPLIGSLYYGRMANFMAARGVGHLTFYRGVPHEELLDLTLWLAKKAGAQQPPPAGASVRIGQIDLRLTPGGSAEALTELHRRIPDLADIPGEELSRFLEIYEGVKKNKKLSVAGISEIVTGFISSFHGLSGSLLALAPLRTLDEYTFTHSTTVCILNLAQAMSLGIEGQLLHDIGVAGMLHDIGKLYVPEEVLTKTDTLTPSEWTIIRQHPVKGAQYLLDTPGTPRLAVVAAFEHHLKHDLTGYPTVAPGWSQSLCSQMTTVSDIFDALRTKRSYRNPMEFSRIVTILQEIAGKDLHPELTRNFISLLTALHEQGEVL